MFTMALMLILAVFVGIVIPVSYGDAPFFMCPSSKKTDGGINVAHLTVSSYGVDSTVILQLVTSECHTCDLQNASFIPSNEKNCSLIVDTRWPSRLAVITNNTKDRLDKGCTNGNLDYTFETGGIYYVYVFLKNETVTCQRPIVINAPSDSNIAIYVTIGLFGAIALLWIGFRKSRRYFLAMISDVTPVVDTEIVSERDLGTPTNVTLGKDSNTKKERLKSLDTFRGLSLVIMMFVNYGGGEYWFFNHSKWNGLTVADLVFPWFVWIMGTALAYSFLSLSRSKAGKCTIFLKIIRRSMTLFVLGLLVNSGGTQNFKKWRVMGVLQRFSLTYLITASVQLLFMSNNSKNTSRKYVHFMQDVTIYWKEWIVHLGLILLHSLLTFLLHVPGCPTGYLGPGGLANDGINVTLCTGGAAGYIDRTVLGDSQVYNDPTCREIYDTNTPYDPEGILGTLTSCFLCFLGLQAGKILTTYKNPKSRVSRFLVWSFILGLIAGILCKFSKNDGWIPVNKNLWSLSYIFTMASMAFLLLTFCYVMVDVYNIWTGAPFFYPGMNSIVVYVCHEVFNQPFQTFWDIHPASHAIALLMNIWDVTFWVLMSVYLYYKNIFINV